MKRQTRTGIILGLAGSLGIMGLGVSSWARTPDNVRPPVVDVRQLQEGDRIQIAILLDTSSSMDGLIEQTKSQLWKIVNEFATAKRQGKRPRIEIALYEYGKSSLASEQGFIRQILPLTKDLDRVSEELFALRTDGGDEFAGMVIRDASRDLAWSKDPADLKMVFIAGNEGFDQGPVAFRDAITKARAQGIVINTIYCGSAEDGIATLWREGAKLAAGGFTYIDQNSKVAAIATPYDAELARLSGELNSTYVGYGARGADRKQRQVAQDKNAESVAQGAATERAISKAGGAYRNDDWDLVDAAKGGKKVEELRDEELPAEMKAMNASERKAYVAKKSAERERIQARIKQLDGDRRKFIAAEQAKAAPGKSATLDKAMNEMVHQSAEAAGYSF
jgi:von Willebrand factor type A domain